MAEDGALFEFLSKCWVPFVASEHRTYYAFGNTLMQDFLRDFKVSSEMDILVLGLGDVRHVMATVAGLSQRPPSSADEVKEISFHLNDFDKDVIARDIILLEIMNKLDPESKSDAEFLWNVWYNAFITKRDLMKLKTILGDLIDKYSNSSRDSERICKFGDKQSLKSVLKTWNCWLNRKLNQSAVKRSRLKSFEDAGYTMSFDDGNIAQYASMQIYIDRGIKESDVKAVGKEMLRSAIDGFVNFSDERKGRKDFANPTFMRPGCDEWRVEDGAHAAACYLPLQKELFEKHSTIHEACFEKMRKAILYYLESWKVTKVTYTFWATDLFHLCHWLLPSDMTFDFIFASNLMDHVGLMNLLLITQPRLKNSQSMLLTESHNWNGMHETLEEFFTKELRCNYLLLPSMIGLRFSEDLNLGTSSLQGFYRTMYARHSDTESICWTKSLNQENVQIDLEGSPKMQEALLLLLMSTFWNKRSTNSASSVRQTPLALMYCFQRLHPLIKGGMATLLEFVELVMNDRSMDYSRNRNTWDVVCWAFGLKHERDQLCIVKIPFKDVNSRLVAMKKHCNLNCRLRLDYNNSSNKEEVLSLFQYDAIGQHFQVPILESAWKDLPDNATISIIDSDSDQSQSLLQELGNRKVPIKRVGKVTATYNQPKQTDAATTNSVEFITCYEDVDKYRLQKALGAETKASFDLLCQLIVSGCKNNMGLESPAEVEVPYKFSCAVDSYEIKDVDENHIQAMLHKHKTFNIGKTILPFRLIDDSELLPFTSGHDIKTYLEETMICDLMFCSPTDIESRARALNGQYLLTDDAFMVLRVVIEQMWKLGSRKDTALQHILQLEIRQQRETSRVLILDVEGYYMYDGLPLVRIRSVELDRNSAARRTNKESTIIYAKDRRCLELLKEMLFTNSLRMSQERPASVEMTAPSSQSLNTFLQMVFLKESGEDMASALHIYPSNVSVVKNYIEKIYSASIRQNYVAGKKSSSMLQKQMMEWMSSFSTKTAPFPSGEHKSDSTTSKNSSNLPLKQKAATCAECKKSTTDLMKCSRCKTVAYCSKECQLKDWPRHKKNCSSVLLKTDDDFTTKKSTESRPRCSIQPKNISGSSTKPGIQDCQTNESRIKDASSTKMIENDPLTKAKIEDCSSVKSNSEGSSIVKPESKDNSEEDSVLKPNSEYYISKSNNDDGGAPTKTKDGDHCSTMEINDDEWHLESSPIEDRTKADNSRMLSNFQPSHSEKKKKEIGSSLKADNPFQPHLQVIKSNDENDAIPDSSVGPSSVELCMYCQLEKTEMKKCTNCKSAAYCSRECQRADWKRHRLKCQTQKLQSAQPLMTRCNGCGVLGKEMKKCSQCKSANYCSPECQRKDWKNHKTTCRRP